MTKDNDEERLDAIVEEASKLPIEQQESVLATIKGMLFTGRYYMSKEEKKEVLMEKNSF